MILHHGCFHIRKSADRSLFAAPRSLSQLVTSFIGSWCQGIHLMLLFAWTSYLRMISHSRLFSFSELLEFLRNIFQVAVKKLSLSHRFLRFSSCFQLLLALPLSTRRNCIFYPTFLKDLYFLQISVLNICSFLLFHFIRFSMNMVVGTADWLAQVDSNHRPRAYQARALTTWAMRQ